MFHNWIYNKFFSSVSNINIRSQLDGAFVKTTVENDDNTFLFVIVNFDLYVRFVSFSQTHSNSLANFNRFVYLVRV